MHNIIDQNNMIIKVLKHVYTHYIQCSAAHIIYYH